MPSTLNLWETRPELRPTLERVAQVLCNTDRSEQSAFCVWRDYLDQAEEVYVELCIPKTSTLRSGHGNR